MKSRLIILMLLLGLWRNAHAQDDSLIMATLDTTALYDSILQELRDLGLVPGKRKSFADVNVGLGNSTFSLQDLTSDKGLRNALVTSVGTGYYHKSGLGLSGGMNLTNDGGNFIVYQGYISPSFDYQGNKAGFGISGFKYFNKESTGFYLSPLVNELYGYFIYRKGWLVPKLAIDYAWGNYDELAGLQYVDTFKYRRLAPVVRYLSRQERVASVSDVSLIFSLRHDFYFFKNIMSPGRWRVTPSVMMVAGTSTYGTNLPLNSLNGPRMSSFTGVTLFQELYGGNFAAPESKFQVQNINFNAQANYQYRKFYLQGQAYLSYAIPAAYSGWNFFYHFTSGMFF